LFRSSEALTDIVYRIGVFTASVFASVCDVCLDYLDEEPDRVKKRMIHLIASTPRRLNTLQLSESA
jgi:hypothetical protein